MVESLLLEAALATERVVNLEANLRYVTDEQIKR